MRNGLELFEDVEDALLGWQLAIVCSCCACAELEDASAKLVAVDRLDCSLSIGSCRLTSYARSLIHLLLRPNERRSGRRRHEAPPAPLTDDWSHNSNLPAPFWLPQQ